MTRLILLLLLLQTPASQPVAIDAPPLATDASLAALDASLAAIDQLAGAIQSIDAEFVQEKRSPLLADPLITRGRIRAIRNVSRWDAFEPQPMVTHMSGRFLSIYYPAQSIVEEYELTDAIATLTASVLPRLSALRETFVISPDAGADLPAGDSSIAIRLVPRDQSLLKYVDHVRVVLDAKQGIVIAYELTDPDDEVTLTTFSHAVSNAGMTPGDLDLKLPANVKRISPGGSAR